MKQKKQHVLFLICFCLLILGAISSKRNPIFASTVSNNNSEDPLIYVLFSDYPLSMQVGETFQLKYVTSSTTPPKWSSSNSKVATVSSDGLLTAKHSGTTIITLKISGASSSCKIHVKKTKLQIEEQRISLERNDTHQINVKSSSPSKITYKSNRPSVVTVDSNGSITALKPGQATISILCDDTKASISVTVKKPTISCQPSILTLYRGQKIKLEVSVSSNVKPTFKTNKKSVAIVDENGIVTAVKHGEACISIKVDGVTKKCSVIVKSPKITLSDSKVTLSVGQSKKVSATCSSNQPVTWSSSNSNIVSIDQTGKITAKKAGTAKIYAKEDGAKETISVTVK